MLEGERLRLLLHVKMNVGLQAFHRIPHYLYQSGWISVFVHGHGILIQTVTHNMERFTYDILE